MTESWSTGTSRLRVHLLSPGVPVEFQTYDGLSHEQAGLPFLEQAQTFLTQRFETVTFDDGCADLGPGELDRPRTDTES